MTINVLLVAPASDLEWQAVEVETLVNLAADNPRRISVRLVRSPATHRAVIDAAAVRGVDVLWFSGHGVPAGVLLDDGLFDVTSLLLAVQLCRCEMVVINTCTSIALAGDVCKRGVDAIATVAEQNDRRAWLVATSFARALLGDGRPVAAFLRTAAHDRNTQYLRGLRDE